MKKHIVKRTWTRRDGTKVTKTYEYGVGKSRRGITLISKSGKLNKKNFDKFKAEIQNSTEYSLAEKRALLADLNAVVKNRLKNQKKLTSTGFMGEIAADKIERMFANAGYSLEEAARELEVSEAELLDTSNWSGEEFTSKKGKFKFRFDYTGNMFERA